MPVVVTVELEVLRKGRHVASFEAAGDPADAGWAQKRLREWLHADGWAPSRWGEFELLTREEGRGRPVRRVRA
jgi:hypothetical protein